MKFRNAKKYVKENLIELNRCSLNPYSAVMIQVPFMGVQIVAIGSVVCGIEDEFDYFVGQGKAYQKAIETAARDVMKLDSVARKFNRVISRAK